MELLSTTSRNCPRCRTEYPPNVEVCPKDNTRTVLNEEQQSDHPLINKFIGSYRVKKQIGSGAAGEVFLAEHPTLGKRVAIKLLKQRNSQDRELVARFFAEAKAVSQLEHPNIVSVLDLSVLPDGRAYYVMEHLEGQSLSRRLITQRQIIPYEALSLAIEILQGLSAAHRKGIIHRDIKPANLFLVERSGSPTQLKLLDFGIAKLLNSNMGKPVVSLPGTILGTPAYMAPEQCFGGDVTFATDLYAVGMVLYEMLAGELPLEEQETPRRSTSHLRSRCPGLPAAMEVILAKALDPSASKRFSSADEMITALRALQTQLPPPNEEAMLVATNPRVMLPTPKAGSAVTESIAPPSPSVPKALYVPPPGQSAQGLVNSEAPTVPIHSALPPLVFPKVTQTAPKPFVEPPRPIIAPAPVVHMTTHPSPPNELVPPKQKTSAVSIWIAIFLGGLLAIGLIILLKLQSMQGTEKTTPPPLATPTTNVVQDLSIAVSCEPADAQIKISANGELISQGNGKIEGIAAPNSKITIEVARAGYQSHKQSFIAKIDSELKIALAPETSPATQATVTFIPVPPKPKPTKPNEKRPKLQPNDDPLKPNDTLDDAPPKPDDTLDDTPAPTDDKTPKPDPKLD